MNWDWQKKTRSDRTEFCNEHGMHAHCLRPLEDNWLYLAASSHYLFEEEVGLLVFFLESLTFMFSL
jgi:hypothetical protein